MIWFSGLDTNCVIFYVRAGKSLVLVWASKLSKLWYRWSKLTWFLWRDIEIDLVLECQSKPT